MYPRRADNLSEETTQFLDENDIRVVVDSIVSVVSGSLSEAEENYGASLYFDGQSFQHSVDCECMACLLSTDTPESRDVRRRLFPNEYSQLIQEEGPANMPEDRTCSTCGMCESYSMRMHNREFIETNDWPTRNLCVDCYDIENLCQTCGQPIDWSVPCECRGNIWFIDREGDSTYLGEYENDELPENNTEKVKQVKESVKEMGSLVFDLQKKLSEGEYLKLMDHLQKITNSVNSL